MFGAALSRRHQASAALLPPAGSDTIRINQRDVVRQYRKYQMPITTRQAKAARALLAWSQEDLAEASGVSIPTVKRLEAEDGPIGGRADTGAKLQAALEAAGVQFISENGGGLGVRLEKRDDADRLAE